MLDDIILNAVFIFGSILFLYSLWILWARSNQKK